MRIKIFKVKSPDSESTHELSDLLSQSSPRLEYSNLLKKDSVPIPKTPVINPLIASWKPLVRRPFGSKELSSIPVDEEAFFKGLFKELFDESGDNLDSYAFIDKNHKEKVRIEVILTVSSSIDDQPTKSIALKAITKRIRKKFSKMTLFIINGIEYVIDLNRASDDELVVIVTNGDKKEKITKVGSNEVSKKTKEKKKPGKKPVKKSNVPRLPYNHQKISYHYIGSSMTDYKPLKPYRVGTSKELEARRRNIIWKLLGKGKRND